jgi:hypothetical protein
VHGDKNDVSCKANLKYATADESVTVAAARLQSFQIRDGGGDSVAIFAFFAKQRRRVVCYVQTEVHVCKEDAMSSSQKGVGDQRSGRQ